MIEQAIEAYTWRALYPDDFLDECDATQGFASVDQDRLCCLALYDCAGELSHRVDVPQGAQGVFFRRRSTEIGLSPDEPGHFSTIAHCIGWKRDGEAVYLFVLDNNSTILTNNLQAI
jgi:hypothetical protein